MPAFSESWLPVLGWENLYLVSNRGRVLSVRTQKLLIPQRKGGRSSDSHRYVTLSDGLRTKKRDVAHLVLESHVCPRPDGAQACHLDDDGSNNALANLYWGTYQTNGADKARNNTHCPAGHEYTPDNTYEFTRKDGRQEKHCRQCRRDRAFEKYQPTRGRHSRRHGRKPRA